MQKILPLAGLMLVSDIDGTLLPHNKLIPERNRCAVERFTEKGGLFTFATGRSNLTVKRYADEMGVKAPVIIYNGAALYDFEKAEFIWKTHLPRSSEEIVRKNIRKFPDLGIEIFVDGDIYKVNGNHHPGINFIDKSIEYIMTEIDNAPKNWNKVVFIGGSERLMEMKAFTDSRSSGNVHYVFSSPNFYEMLPAGVSKGSAVKLLAERFNILPQNVMAIGDYDNDLELVKSAAVSAVPSGASGELKEAADMVVCSCEDGAVADFIEYIEKHFSAE